MPTLPAILAPYVNAYAFRAMPSAQALMLRMEPLRVSTLRASILIAGENA